MKNIRGKGTWMARGVGSSLGVDAWLKLVDITQIKINFAAPWLRIRVSECATHSL